MNRVSRIYLRLKQARFPYSVVNMGKELIRQSNGTKMSVKKAQQKMPLSTVRATKKNLQSCNEPAWKKRTRTCFCPHTE